MDVDEEGSASSAHLRQHGDDANEQCLAFLPPVLRDELQDATRVKDRTALHGGAARDSVEALAVGVGRLADALSDVLWDRERCFLELLLQSRATAGQRFDDLEGECEELDGELIDVEFLVVE